jgi:hypothetical protein
MSQEYARSKPLSFGYSTTTASLFSAPVPFVLPHISLELSDARDFALPNARTRLAKRPNSSGGTKAPIPRKTGLEAAFVA